MRKELSIKLCQKNPSWKHPMKPNKYGCILIEITNKEKLVIFPCVQSFHVNVGREWKIF